MSLNEKIFLQIISNSHSRPHTRQSRSVLTTKLPRSNLADGTIEPFGGEYIPETYFPDVQFPKDIFEAVQPFVFRKKMYVSDAFGPDVKANFNDLSGLTTGEKGSENASPQVDEISEVTHVTQEELVQSTDLL